MTRDGEWDGVSMRVERFAELGGEGMGRRTGCSDVCGAVAWVRAVGRYGRRCGLAHWGVM